MGQTAEFAAGSWIVRQSPREKDVVGGRIKGTIFRFRQQLLDFK
jgi:hypothetical protein